MIKISFTVGEITGGQGLEIAEKTSRFVDEYNEMCLSALCDILAAKMFNLAYEQLNDDQRDAIGRVMSNEGD